MKCVLFINQETPFLNKLSISATPCHMGDYVQLTCIASKGDLPIAFTWYLNEQRISGDLATLASLASVGDHTSLLLINNVTSPHAGRYTCEASNAAGSANKSATLTVNGRQRNRL